MPLYLGVQAQETLELDAEQAAHTVVRSLGPAAGDTLPNRVPRAFERSFGTSFDHVRLHDGPEAARAARRIDARAFTIGRDIFFASDQNRPHSSEGRFLLAHELAHVQQQIGGQSGRGLVKQRSTPRIARRGLTSQPMPLFGAAQPGPRSLLQSLDVTQLNADEIQAELHAIDGWLRARSDQSSEDHELLRQARGQLVAEAGRRGIDLDRRPAPPPPDSLFMSLDLANLSAPERRAEARRIRGWLAHSQESSEDNERLREVLTRLGDLDRFERSPPVLWGLATSNRHLYASVAAPGYTLRQIATYLYGSEAHVEALLAANPGLSDGMLLPGTPIQFAAGVNRSEMAHMAMNSSLREGTALRTTDIPTAPDPDAGEIRVYRIGGRLVTESQLPGVLEGSRVWVQRKLTYVRDMLQNGLEVRNGHEKDTNDLVRGISDWMGDVDLPSSMLWLLPKSRCQVALSVLGKLGDSSRAKAAGITSATGVLRESAEDLNRATNAWRVYIRGTIEGASTTVSRLEFVRDVSFGVAAGLAGAVAAPAVFAAAGGGLLGTGAAIGAGSAVGAGTGAGLEFTSSVAGEGVAMGLTPGNQSFDWEYVGHRTWEGTKSGAIQGGLGAAGALAAPGVSNVLANRMYGANAMNLATGGQRFLVNAATATTIGAPSGAVGAAIENVDDWYRGDISGGEFGSRVGLGAAFGGVSGAATSWIPINGLYRSGGRLFRGDAITPRWMMEGIGFNPHQVNPDFAPTLNPLRMRSALASRYSFNPTGQGFAGFNALPLDQLPPLAPGHRWLKLNGEWHPVATSGRFGDPYSLGIQGENFNFLMGQRGQPQRLMMSRAMTRPTAVQPAAQGRSEMGVRAFREGGHTGPAHTPGHNVDLADTSNLPFHATGELTPAANVTNTNRDIFNYTPEPRSSTAGNRSVSDWGQYLRNPQVGEIRTPGGGYRQYNSESATGRTVFGYRETSPTASSIPVVETPIPDSIVFVATDSAGNAVTAWRVDFLNPPTHNPPTQIARGLQAMRNAPPRVPGTVQSVSSLPLADLPVILEAGIPVQLVPSGGAGAIVGDALASGPG